MAHSALICRDCNAEIDILRSDRPKDGKANGALECPHCGSESLGI